MAKGYLMSEVLWGKLIDIVPSLLWILFALVVFFSLRRPFLETIVPRITSIGALGVEVTLTEVERLLNKVAENASGEKESNSATTRANRRAVLHRLEHAANYLKGGRILWVDDIPSNNQYLTEMFRELDMKVDQATSTSEALNLLNRSSYDLVISDIHRGKDGQAGIKMLHNFREQGINLPVLVHADHFDPRLGVDPMIFGYTPQYDELIHYVIDVMERVRLSDG
ncbi:response regulator [Streptosporangium sp. NPDC023825]|uniref:response regulator n=1 Tax=Streptosporangium sp. NPDC023825 TaxID=3154909 RepID=UPI0034204E3D